jgi:hypothetical protein
MTNPEEIVRRRVQYDPEMDARDLEALWRSAKRHVLKTDVGHRALMSQTERALASAARSDDRSIHEIDRAVQSALAA